MSSERENAPTPRAGLADVAIVWASRSTTILTTGCTISFRQARVVVPELPMMLAPSGSPAWFVILALTVLTGRVHPVLSTARP